MTTKDCIFCKIVRGEIKTSVIKTSNSFIAFADINPVVEGHILIIPKSHYVTLLDIPQNLAEEMLKFVKEVGTELLERKLGDGFNIIMNNLPPAGQVVPHAHIHVIPRKEGDGLRFLTRT